MASYRKVPLAWSTVFANTTAARFMPATGWLSASEVESIRGTFEVISDLDPVEVTLAYQTADVENNPDVAVAFGTLATSDGVVYPTTLTDISGTTVVQATEQS